MQLDHTSATATYPHPPRMPSTIPPPPARPHEAPPEAATTPTTPPSLLARLTAWAEPRTSDPARPIAVLVLSALVGAWWGAIRFRMGWTLAMVQVEPERYGLDHSGPVHLNQALPVVITHSDPPSPVAVATVAALLDQLDTDAAGLARIRAPAALDILVPTPQLRAALEAVEPCAGHLAALYQLDTDDGPFLVVLGAGWIVAQRAEPWRAHAAARAVELDAAPLASLVLGRVPT